MSTPNSKPVGIASPRLRSDDAASFDSRAVSGSPGRAGWAGTPPPPNIPPRFISAGSRPGSFTPTAGAAFPNSRTSTPRDDAASGQGNDYLRVAGGVPPDDRGGRATPTLQDLDDLPDEDKAKVLRRHLVSREEREAESLRRPSVASARPPMDAVQFNSNDSGGSSYAPSVGPGEDLDPFPVPFSSAGGDITHNIYKWHSDARRDALRRARSASLIGAKTTVDPAFQHIREPGGFRRNYLMLKANEDGVEQPPMLNNFIDFLFLYGHFGGEDLEEDEDDEEGAAYDDEAGPSGTSRAEEGLSGLHQRAARQPLDLSKPLTEERPLLARNISTMRSVSRAKRRQRSVSHAHGDASVTQAVLMLLKSFIGTGILFLGKAFFNGGILFSAITLIFIGLISLYSFILLVRTKFVVPGSFGDIGGELYGKWMRLAILISIILSQIGFCAAYTIFIASNLHAFILAVSNCRYDIPMRYLIFVQSIVLLPLSFVRNLAKLSGTALVADVFILIGLIYIGSNEIATIATKGVADVALFNPTQYPLLIGTAVFSFEGIGLVIPITDAMREPRRFPAVLTGVMLFLTALFAGAGVLSYAAYGSEVQTVILVNLPTDQKFVQVVQFLYAMAILLSTPLQLFPAIRIMENFLFTRSGKTSTKVKWEKNGFRALTVVACYLISWAGASDLDKFVSFIGSFACIPLCYVYPAMLHYRACSRTRWAKTKDIALMVFGMAAAIFATVQTVKLMLEPAGAEPDLGRCAPAQPGDHTIIQALRQSIGI